MTRFHKFNVPDAIEVEAALTAAFARHKMAVMDCTLTGSPANAWIEMQVEAEDRRIVLRVATECFMDGSLEATLDAALARS